MRNQRSGGFLHPGRAHLCIRGRWGGSSCRALGITAVQQTRRVHSGRSSDDAGSGEQSAADPGGSVRIRSCSDSQHATAPATSAPPRTLSRCTPPISLLAPDIQPSATSLLFDRFSIVQAAVYRRLCLSCMQRPVNFGLKAFPSIRAGSDGGAGSRSEPRLTRAAARAAASTDPTHSDSDMADAEPAAADAGDAGKNSGLRSLHNVDSNEPE